MQPWPELDYQSWKDTYQTLHRWLQIVGKWRLIQSEVMNHSWGSVMYVTPVGLTTSPIPVHGGTVSVDFDFSEHSLKLVSSRGEKLSLHLQSESVAEFYARFMNALESFGVPARIDVHPNELADAVPFPDDITHHTYKPEQVENLWHALVIADLLLKKFRAKFTGKASPVHLFWGSFDLAVTFFSGRKAPPHPGGVPNLPDIVAREAYSHEVSSFGFWPGNEVFPQAAFYSYAYPEPLDYKSFPLQVKSAYYHKTLQEFILPYDSVRTHAEPVAAVMSFLKMRSLPRRLWASGIKRDWSQVRTCVSYGTGVK